MKNNYKKVSSHGSINIPIAMRREIGLQTGDPMEVSLSNGVITVRPYMPRCTFCGVADGVRQLLGKGICTECAQRAVQAMKGDGE